MSQRFVSIWFRHLTTDWFALRQPSLKNVPFVLRASSHNKIIITAANAFAEVKGIHSGMTLADARAVLPALEVEDDKPGLIEKLLTRLAEWCIRFSPVVAIDPPDGLLLDATGCSHLWGGDIFYVQDILRKLQTRGYDVRAAMADTIGTAWAVARYGKESFIIPGNRHIEALLPLPPEALRIETEVSGRLHKLGLHQIKQFINMSRPSLRRRFGQLFLTQLDKATGQTMEMLEPVYPIEPYQERLPCMEPIVTATGIEIALKQLLETLCRRLLHEQKGLRSAIFKGFRVDGKTEQISIGTNRPTHHVSHLFRLFELNINTIEPDMGIELFVLEAPKVEDYLPHQEKMWEATGGLHDTRLAELLDRLANKISMSSVHRYIPDEHYWPERSFKQAMSIQEAPSTTWPSNKLRPLQILSPPESIEVTAPIPDYPPMLFRRNGKIHKIVKADGPERIEQEWWLQQGQHRDYYRVEDEEGHRYWLFRLGHYNDKTYQWFLHGMFS